MQPSLRHAGRSRHPCSPEHRWLRQCAASRDEAPLQPERGTQPHSPLGVEDAEEHGPAPVLTRQGEDSPQVVEGDVALGQATLQPRFLEGGPLFLQSPGATQVSLRGGADGVD